MTRVALFFTSYAPLFAILALRFNPPALRLVCLTAAILGMVTFVLVVTARRRVVEADPYRAKESADEGAAVAGYLATYLLPFVTVGEPDRDDLAAYVVYFLLLAVLHARTNLTQVNPLLYITGRKVLRVTTDEGFTGYAIVPTDVDLPPGCAFHGRALSGNVLLVDRVDVDDGGGAEVPDRL